MEEIKRKKKKRLPNGMIKSLLEDMFK